MKTTRSEAELRADREDDARIDLEEAVKEWCYGNGARNLNHSDKEIAYNVERKFGIAAEAILNEFKSPEAPNYNTFEQIMRAYDNMKGASK